MKIVKLILLITAFLLAWQCAYGVEFTEKNCIRAAIGEASSQGYQGLLAVCCGIRNRGTLKGVYGVNSKHIDKEPKYVWNMARKAWKESEHNRIHSGDHWENTKSFGEPYWAKKMIKVYEYKDHIFFKEK